jgi:hypothetical protein
MTVARTVHNRRKSAGALGLAAAPPVAVVDMSSLRTNLKAWWEVNEASGTRADSHTSGITYSDSNSVGSAAGKQGNAADFEKSSNEKLYNFAASALAPSTNDWTIAFWFNIESATEPNIFWSGAFSNNLTKLAIRHRATGDVTYGDRALFVYYVRNNGSSITALHTDEPALSTWYHCLVEYTHSTTTLGITLDNGTPQTTNVSSQLHGSQPIERIAMGGFYSGTATLFDGLIDEFGFWHRLLTSEEKGWLYNSGDGISYGDTA